MSCDNSNPIEQAVEFSTRGGIETLNNVSRPQAWWTNSNPNGATTQWQWTFTEMHKDAIPRFAAIQRGLVLRFEPKYQFPFKSLHIDSVNLPVWGMMSHVIGKVIMTLDGIPAPPTPNTYNYPDVSKVEGVFTLIGWDCQSAHDVLMKYYKILTAQVHPDIADKLLEFTSTPSGAYSAVVKVPGVTFKVDFLVQNQLYVNRLERFFGRKVNGLTSTYLAPLTGYDPMEFPFVYNIRLNTRLVTQQLAERSFSRNLESTTQTQVIASFPWTGRSMEEVGGGAAIQKHFFAVAPTISKNTLTSAKDFCCVQSIDFWFTYGENDDNLYETFLPSIEDSFTPTNVLSEDAAWSKVTTYDRSSPPVQLYTFDLKDGPAQVDSQTVPPSRTWVDVFFRRELSIFGTFNRCGCKTNVNDPRYFLAQ